LVEKGHIKEYKRLTKVQTLIVCDDDMDFFNTKLTDGQIDEELVKRYFNKNKPLVIEETSIREALEENPQSYTSDDAFFKTILNLDNFLFYEDQICRFMIDSER